MRHAARRSVELLVFVALFVAVFGFAAMAMAAASPKIVEPSKSPYTLQLDSAGKLQPFTIRASGFQSGQQVYVEQCDGVAITDPHWTPAVDCDIGTAGAGVRARVGDRRVRQGRLEPSFHAVHGAQPPR